jgi:lipid-A-disaccharide synthase-like uncharacterized protein
MKERHAFEYVVFKAVMETHQRHWHISEEWQVSSCQGQLLFTDLAHLVQEDKVQIVELLLE